MKLFSEQLLDELTAKAAASPRMRAHHNIHSSPEDRVQRFLVAAQRGSYFRPHRHRARSELALILRGQADVLTFDPQGTVTGRYRVGPGTGEIGFETPQATWHTLFAVTEDMAFLEIKEGPYDPATASEFAPWSPAEGHESVSAFQRWLRQAQPGNVVPAST